MKIGVFISYYTDDQKLKDRLRSKLKQSQVLKPIVLTEKERDDASLLNTEKVAKGIIQSKYFIPILTLNSLKSQWVNQEIGFAAAKGKLIYPIIQDVLLTDKQLKGWVHSEKDQPYRFKISENEKKSREAFRSAYQPLLKVLEELSQPITLSALHAQEKAGFRKGEIIYVDNKSRHLLVNDYIYPLENGEVYNQLMKMNGRRERHVTKREFESYPIERLIR